MATSEQADEDLPTFSLGMDFLTPEKEPRERENKTINGFISFRNSNFISMHECTCQFLTNLGQDH